MSGNILVADSDPNIVEIVTESLRSEGYHTESASDGQEAMSKFREFDPDLVILDTVLPVIGGLQVCENIRVEPGKREIPIIIMSGGLNGSSVAEGFRHGASDVIKKPFSIEEITARANNFLTRAGEEKKQRMEGGEKDFEYFQREFKRKVLNLRTLFDLSQDFNRLKDPDELVHILCLTLIGQLGIGSVAIFRLQKNDYNLLEYAGGMGIETNILQTVNFSKESGLIKYLSKFDNFIDLANRGIPGAGRREAHFLVKLGLKYCFPLIIKENLIGIILVGEKINCREYSDNDIEMFRLLCHSAANALENARLYTELQDTYLSTIRVLVSTIEAKDPYTSGHTDRVAGYSSKLARRMGMSKKEIETIEFGAALHDIGKLGVYENILNKSSALTEKEWIMVKSHPEIGANIIRDMSFLKHASDLVRHHHERLDGSGYPDGLKGDEISLGAKIIAVADSFDAMTSNRPYRKPLTYPEAIEQLRMQSNKFDAEIVETFAEIIESRVKVT
ncbi:MAG: response regulator [Candidatus Latescibacteria bacterium]|nr:response regulator [bacterium]MBD3423004.1 response regulator [Candidatus Latescibacterota bacterium]